MLTSQRDALEQLLTETRSAADLSAGEQLAVSMFLGLCARAGVSGCAKLHREINEALINTINGEDDETIG
jgi:hypothetical protein